MQRRQNAARPILRRLLLGAVLVGLPLVPGALPLRAADEWGVEEGLIVMRTLSANFYATFTSNWFDQGSDPVIAMNIHLEGTALRAEPAGILGNGDTILDLKYLDGGPARAYELKVIGFHLKTPEDQPVTVTYNGGARSEQWDVEVCLSEAPQLRGVLQLSIPNLFDLACPVSIPFGYAVAVTPRLIFTRRGDSLTRTLDPGGTGFISFGASGLSLNRTGTSFSNAQQFVIAGAEQGLSIDASCTDVFEDVTSESSNVILGAHCSSLSSASSWHPEPLEEGCSHSAVVEAATRASTSYPASETDRWADGLVQPGGRAGAGLAGLALLGFAAVLIPARRDRDG